jgi:hypothetical protein
MSEGPASDAAPSTGDSLGRVAVATVAAAACAYLVLLPAACALGADGYAAFAVFWAAYGLVTGTQNGQLQETTRAVRRAREREHSSGARLMPMNAVVGVALAAVVARCHIPRLGPDGVRLLLTVIAVAAGWGLQAFLVITVAGTVSTAVVRSLRAHGGRSAHAAMYRPAICALVLYCLVVAFAFTTIGTYLRFANSK